MILQLFWALFIISALLIVLGIMYASQWGGMCMIGFTILFLLSYTIVQGQLQVETGINSVSSYNYSGNGTVTSTSQVATYLYSNWSDTNSHTIGFIMAILSFIGFASSLLALRVSWRKKE